MAPRPASLLIIAACCAAAIPAHAAGKAVIRVRPSKVIGPVNRLLFGQNQLAYQNSADEYGNRGSGIWDPVAWKPVPEYLVLSRECGMSNARWPGGCEAHKYNWKKTVGPLANRPTQQFGLPEFMAYCEAVGCSAMLTVAVYWGTSQDAADLVEYLNAPDDGANPNGGVDWAAMRAADGHPKPYGVVWFEYGNEDYHGDHGTPPTKVTPEEYARSYLEYRAAMRAVDPRIKLGALIQNGLDEWDRTVLRIAGRDIDFGIEHSYLPGYWSDETVTPGEELMKACVACDARLQEIYDSLNALVKEVTGRTDFPWAVTEYNGAFVQEKPVPYRQTLGNALCNAEHLRVMMRPQNRIAVADFWQFANEYWGAVQGYVHRGATPVKQANYTVYEFYARHFGDSLIESQVECPTFDFDGAAGVPPRRGKPSRYRLYEENLLPADATFELRAGTPVKQELDGDTVIATFPGADLNYYHPRLVLPVKPLTGYRVMGLVKTEGFTGTVGAGFQAGDARGWTATKSAAVNGDVRGSTDWTKVVVDYTTLADTREIEVLCRRVEGGGPVSGVARYRLLSVQQFDPANAGAAPCVSVNAARRRDGALTLMIVNKDLHQPTPTEIDAPVAAGAVARAWSLTGSSPVATNLGPTPQVTVVETAVTRAGGRFFIELPPCSLTAVQLGP